MKKIKLKVISTPEKNSCAIIKLSDKAKIIGQKGEYTLFCGNCNNILAEDVLKEQISNLVFLCKCGTHNVVPTDWSIFKLVDIKEVPRYSIIIFGISLIILGIIFGGFGFWGKILGLLASVVGAILSLFNKKIVKYFE